MIRKMDNVGETIFSGVSDDRALITGTTIGMGGVRSMMASSHPRNRLVLISLTPSDGTLEYPDDTAPGSIQPTNGTVPVGELHGSQRFGPEAWSDNITRRAPYPHEK
jgi:hypothetical protein